jgi:hypothetical protein
MTRLALFTFALFCLFGLAAPLHAQKNEATLVSAWEQEQKSDPTTLKFEKLADRKYHFATKRFPFDGELLVRNVSIQEFGGEDDFGAASGTVEVELQNVGEEFHRTFAVSYGQWILGNTLSWDAKNQRWLTVEQNMKQLRERLSRIRPGWSMLLSWGWLVIFLVILVALLFPLFRYNRRWKEITARNNRSLALTERAIQLSERNVQLQEEHAKLLQEIRDLLKK